jgi:hypothetical protein
MTIAEAREIYRIPDAWRDCGYEGEPKKRCRCPFHEDRSPSFSVYNDDKSFKCFAGCGEGDVADFLAKGKGFSKEDACREVIRRAGGSRPAALQQKVAPPGRSETLELPTLVPYSPEIAQRVANSRGLSLLAVEFPAVILKTVVFARVCEEKCWILTDASGKSAEARRINGKPFPAIGTLAERKSHSLRGSTKSWPVGITPEGFQAHEHIRKILLVEGAPDYLAACQLIAAQDENILPVAMLGASASISQQAIKYFACRNVTIVAHPDNAGREAAMRWGTQLQDGGAIVQAIQLKKGDLCSVVASGETYEHLVRS